MKFVYFICGIALLSACSVFSGDKETAVIDEEEAQIEVEVVKVFVSKERLQCEDESGRPVSDTRNELQDDGIKVFSSSCAIITGKLSPSLCGRATLHINIHGIDARKVEQADALGYKLLESLDDEDLGYDTDACN